jgi:putative monooxygenase
MSIRESSRPALVARSTPAESALERYRSGARTGAGTVCVATVDARRIVMPSTRQPTARKVAPTEVAPNRGRGGELRVLLGPANAGATAGFLGVLTLAPGEFVSEHYHPYSEEFLYAVTGTVDVRVDGEEITVAEGEALFVPIGARHRVTNRSAATAVLTFQLGPLAPRPDLGHVDTEPRPGTGPELSVGPA